MFMLQLEVCMSQVACGPGNAWK